jgi:hypothetical protein
MRLGPVVITSGPQLEEKPVNLGSIQVPEYFGYFYKNKTGK